MLRVGTDFGIFTQSNGVFIGHGRAADNSFVGNNTGFALNTNEHHHFCITRDSSGIRLYLDGVLMDTTNYAAGDTPKDLSGLELVIAGGAGGGTVNATDGRYERWSAWSRSLSTEEVVKDYEEMAKAFSDGVELLDEDDLVSNSDTTAPTQQSVKAYVDAKLIDEDDMVSDSATKSPTQQSVKAYVDTKVSTVSALNPYLPSTRNWTGLLVSGTPDGDSFTARSADNALRESSPTGRRGNYCLDFNNFRSENLYYPTTVGDTIANGAFTIVLSVYPEATLVNDVVIGFTDDVRIWWSATTLYMHHRSGGSQVPAGGASGLDRTTVGLTEGSWYDLCLTFSGGAGGTVTGYINGVSVGTNTVSTPISLAGQALSVGNQHGGGNPSSSRIDFWQIYDRELSAAEVLALHND